MADKLRPCPKCKSDGTHPDGFFWTEYEGQKCLARCKCLETFTEQQRWKRVFSRSHIPFSFFDYNIDVEYKGNTSREEINKMKRYLWGFIGIRSKEEQINAFRSTATYVWGSNGTQKTSTLYWFGAELLKAGFSVRFILMQDLVSLITELRDRDEDAIKEYLECDMLIIDECFDKSKMTVYASGFQLPFLDSFLRKRIQENRKGIVFISNVPPTSIEENKVSHSIQDFVLRNVMKQKTILEFKDNYIENIESYDSVRGLFDGR